MVDDHCMTTPRRCFIHAGLPKTGTSFLQSAFWSSREALAARGFRILMDKQGDHFQATLALRGMLDDAMDPPRAFTALERLADAIASADEADVFFSHESLAPATAEESQRLVGLFAGFEVHVVLTARDLARQIASGWQQRIQERQVHSYEDFLAAVVAREPLADDFWLNQDLIAVAEHWSSAVTPERLHIVTVPPPGSDPDLLLSRFCSVLGIDPAIPRWDTPRGNESLGLVQAELLRRVSLALGDRLPHARAGFGKVGKRYLARGILAPQGGRTPTLPQSLADWCDRTSAVVIEKLRAAGYPVSGDLHDLLPTVSTAPEPTVTEEELNESAVAALARVLELRHAELKELDTMRAAARKHRQRISQLTSGEAAPREPRVSLRSLRRRWSSPR